MLKKFIFIVFFILMTVSTANSIILHDDEMPTDKPSNNIVGRWSSNASCVVISPCWVLTTIHQGGGVGSIVTIDGKPYVVISVYQIINDTRIAKISEYGGKIANLKEYITLGNPNDFLNDTIVIGGYGKGRGTTLYNGEVAYGYKWDASNNQTLRWGTNILDRADFFSLRMSFSGQTDTDTTRYEAALASYDSGGGWFGKNAENAWVVIGVSSGVTHVNESWFFPPESNYARSVTAAKDDIADIINQNTNFVISTKIINRSGEYVLKGIFPSYFNTIEIEFNSPPKQDQSFDNILTGCEYQTVISGNRLTLILQNYLANGNYRIDISNLVAENGGNYVGEVIKDFTILIGDANQSGEVSNSDIIYIRNNTGVVNIFCDINNSGVVTGADYMIARDNLGEYSIPIEEYSIPMGEYYPIEKTYLEKTKKNYIKKNVNIKNKKLIHKKFHFRK